MSWYPVSLNLKGRNCLIIGGGKVAERKLKSLIKAEANVTLIAPKINAILQEMREAGAYHYLNSTYQTNDVNGFFLVIAATDCSETNSRIGADAESQAILFNSANSYEYSNFYPAAASQCGDIQLAVSSNGKNPYLAKKICKYIEQKFDSSLQEDVLELGRLRNQMVKDTLGLGEEEKKAFMKDNLLEKVEVLLDKIDKNTWEL
jgi:precorrin-2 dehydrogenase/sirohydrochlorin ferrochelatase